MAEQRIGFKSLEFYLTGAGVLAKMLWKDFPDDALTAIISYTIARQAQKGFGLFNPETQKYSWQTSEFWLTLGFSVAKSFFPDMPQESLVAVLSWIGMRTGVKGVQGYRAAKNGNGTSQPPTA